MHLSIGHFVSLLKRVLWSDHWRKHEEGNKNKCSYLLV